MSAPLSFEDALAFRARLLNEVVCSAPWLEGIVEQDENGAWRINPDRYPPPGIRACPQCGRICPPSDSYDQWCTDCDGERQELEFVDWAQHSEVKDQLYTLWWRGITYADLIDRGLRLLGEGVAAEPEAAAGQRTGARSTPIGPCPVMRAPRPTARGISTSSNVTSGNGSPRVAAERGERPGAESSFCRTPSSDCETRSSISSWKAKWLQACHV